MRWASRLMIAVVGTAAASLVPAASVPAASAVGDASRGREVYEKQCLVCHSLEPEFHKEGPSLYHVWGRTAGTAPFFGKYKALKGETGIVWNEKTLDQWLTDPRAMVGGRDTGMTLRIEDPQQRTDVIAYLKSLQ